MTACPATYNGIQVRPAMALGRSSHGHVACVETRSGQVVNISLGEYRDIADMERAFHDAQDIARLLSPSEEPQQLVFYVNWQHYERLCERIIPQEPDQ